MTVSRELRRRACHGIMFMSTGVHPPVSLQLPSIVRTVIGRGWILVSSAIVQDEPPPITVFLFGEI